MRRCVFFTVATMAIASGFSLLAHGQFQEPTREELQMTADPKAPGAAAVYLYREETVDDTHHFHTLYSRIKILTEKGKDLATQTIPYEKGSFKISAIQGRTIHSDGKAIPLTAKPEDLMAVKVGGYQRNKMVFTLPDVQVGSILEYRLQVQYSDDMVYEPDWKVQQPYFVHKAHYFFTPTSGGMVTNSHGDPLNRMMYSLTGTKDLKVVRDTQGRYSVDVEDIPATPDEDWMPPLNSLTWGVHIYYTNATSAQDFWSYEAKFWERDTSRFASVSKTLKEAAAEIVGANDSDEVKAHKVYDAVMKLENTDYTREKSEAERKKQKMKAVKDAEGVWKQKSGSSDQLALLYVALARAAGLTAYAMVVSDRDQTIFDPGYLNSRQLDDYLAVLVIGGKEVFLDPGQAQCPFGLLAWKHTFAGGLREGPQGVRLDSTPGNSYTENTMDREADLKMAPDGTATGTIRVVMKGQEALRWRHVAVENDADEVKKQFNEWMKDYVPEGVQVDFDHFLALDDYSTNLVGMMKVSGLLASATGKRYFLPGQFFATHGAHPFVSEEQRRIPVDVHFPERITDDVTYHLPDGYGMDSMPAGDVIQESDYAQFRVTASHQADSVKIGRVLEYNFTLLDAKDYIGLRDFYQKVARADQQQLVLVKQ